MKYYMIRLYTQLNASGDVEDKSAVYVHPNQTAALKQYFKMLSTDIDDANKLTAMCIVMNEYGVVIAKQQFNHVDNAEPTIEE